jgi:VWFA-related protein
MIITSHGVKVIQGLTGDSANLVQILKKVSGELPALQGVDTDAQADAATADIPDVPAPGGDPDAAMQAFVERGDAIYAQFQQQNAIETTMNAFLGIAWTLQGVPGRKAVIWATGGFPFTIYSPDIVPGGNLSILYERAMHALEEAQVAVYPVDVRGLVNSSPISEASKSGVPTVRQINNRAWLQQSTIDSLNEFADMTGGKAFYNTNDLASSFKRAADDASSYYLLGYYLDTHNDRAGWRQLKVKVDKKDTEVRARKGFFVTNATIHAALTRNSDMNFALSSPIEGTGVPVTIEWAGVAGDGAKKKAGFLAHMPPNGLSIDTAAQNKIDFDFAAVAWGEKDGKEAARSALNFSKALADDQLASIRANGVNFKNVLELAPGKYTVRFVVRDNVTGKVGSVTAPLTVD